MQHGSLQKPRRRACASCARVQGLPGHRHVLWHPRCPGRRDVSQRSPTKCSLILDLFLKPRRTSSRCRSLLELKLFLVLFLLTYALVLFPLTYALVLFLLQCILVRLSSPSPAPTSPRLEEVARRSRRS